MRGVFISNILGSGPMVAVVVALGPNPAGIICHSTLPGVFAGQQASSYPVLSLAAVANNSTSPFGLEREAHQLPVIGILTSVHGIIDINLH